MSALNTSSAGGNAVEQELQGGIELLQANLAEVENSAYHLVRSNVELAQVTLPMIHATIVKYHP